MEYSLELALYLGRDQEECDLERVSLLELLLEVGYEDANEASQVAVDEEDVIVDGADPPGKVLMDSGEKVTVRGRSVSQRNDGGTQKAVAPR